MFKVKCFGVLLLIGASFAHANTPLSSGSSIGLGYLVTGGWSSVYGVACSNGCGGQFGATLQPVTPTYPSVAPYTATGTPSPVDIFCVDSQESFGPGAAGYAFVTPVSSIDSNPSTVRFASPTNWENNLSAYVANSNDPGVRYEMAAYLISQYDGFGSSYYVSDSNNSGITTNDPTNDAIQEAIWAITYQPPANGLDSFPNYFGNSAVDAWIQTAASNYLTLQSNWAVVSWNVNNQTGTLDPAGSGANAQTFLIELPGSNTYSNGPATPEPGFYGALMVGLSGLFFAVRRRRKA
jgi:hypothetical protein